MKPPTRGWIAPLRKFLGRGLRTRAIMNHHQSKRKPWKVIKTIFKKFPRLPQENHLVTQAENSRQIREPVKEVLLPREVNFTM
jgi:hypothetical protein